MKNKYNMTEDTLSAGTDGVSSYAVKISGRTSPIPVPANIQAIPENPESGNGVCDHHLDYTISVQHIFKNTFAKYQ